MNGRVIVSLLRKDLTLFFRNRFIALVSLLGVVIYVGIYFLMPETIDETFELALYAPSLPPILGQMLTEEGLELAQYDSEVALREALLAGDYAIGVILPADIGQQLAGGEKATMTALYTVAFPAEFEDMMVVALEEVGFLLSGQPLRVEVSEQVLGTDRAGAQIAERDRMLPLFAVVILLIETLGMASLISSELESGTLRALLITPMRVKELFVAKGITGVGLAFVQACALMVFTGGFDHQPAVILLALLLGALLVTGLGFLMASAARDMMSVMAWAVPAFLVLSIPSIGVLIPGIMTNWIKAIPSYYLVDTVHQVANLSAGWAQVWPNLVVLLLLDLLFVGLGIVALRRKMA